MKWRSLSRTKEFQKVYGEGVKRVGHLLVVYLLPADDRARGVVASRKVGGAVRRNRAKRLLRAAMADSICACPEWTDQAANGLLARADRTDPQEEPRIQQEIGPDIGGSKPVQDGKAGLWIVLVARRSILEANSREVRQELDELLESIAGELPRTDQRS